MKQIPIRRLSRGQRESLQRAKEFGDVAEDVAAETYGVVVDHGDSWYDLVDQSSGAKYQVKSTSSTIGDKYPGNGRFRVWHGQHRSLTACEGSGTAWYVFVLLDEDTGALRLRRMFPSTVTSVVDDRGGWNDSGHQSMGEQRKLPWPAIFDG